MSAPRFNSIEDYLASVDASKARTLKLVIEFILSQFPQLKSKISWNVPIIHLDGKYIVGICAYKKHLTFSPFSPNVIENFNPRLNNYVLKKNCFHIPIDWEIDKELMKDLVKARLAELE